MKIGHKLILGALVLSSLVCAVGVYAVVVSRGVFQESVDESSTEFAAELMHAVDRSICDRLEYWYAFGAGPHLHHLAEISNEQFATLPDLEAYIDDIDVRWQAVGEEETIPEMERLSGNELSVELRQIQRAIERYEGCKVYGEVFVTNRYGAVIAQTARTSDYRQDDEAWWQHAMRDGFYVGDVVYDESSHVYSIDIGVRVDGDTNRPIAVIKTAMTVDSLTSLLDTLVSGSSSKVVHSDVCFYLLSATKNIIYQAHGHDRGMHLDRTYEHDIGPSLAGTTRIFHAEDDHHGNMLGAVAFSNGYRNYPGHNWALVVESDFDQLFAPFTALRNTILWISAAIAVAAFAVAAIFSLVLSRRIGRLRSVAAEMGLGNLGVRADVDAPDELGELAKSINQMAENEAIVARQANTIAQGDYSADITPRCDHDELSNSINRMAASLRDVVSQANAIAEGDYSTTVSQRGENDALGAALNKMTDNLRRTSAQNELNQWLKTGQTELSDLMRGVLDLPTLSRNVVTYLANYLGAQVGVMYVSDDGQTLRLTGSYAFSQRKQLTEEIPLGTGLAGQAALEQEIISISEVPADYIAVKSGLGESAPRHLVAVPIVHDGEVKGVVELGTLTSFDQHQHELLNLVTANIAIAVKSAQDRQTMKQLLQQSQKQAIELQKQQEELRASNEELEEQTEALKQSEERLKSQSEELRAINEELEEKSEYLTQQKARIEKKNRELEVVRQEIEEKARDLELASKYKSEFLANMSHELRTPLNSLLILAKSLADNDDGNLTDEQIESANIICDGGRELLNLINEILDLSKVEAGRLDVHFEDVSLASMVDRLRSQFSPLAEKKRIQLKTEVNQLLPETFISDGQRTEQILKNLLSNAIKFTSQGSVTLRVRRPADDVRFRQTALTPDNTIALSVVDTGIGIPADRQRAIFEAFSQADGSTSRKYGGTGLGLAIARKMSALLGGEIHLQSREGQGSTFTLYLPLQPQKQFPEPAAGSLLAPPPASTPQTAATASAPPYSSAVSPAAVGPIAEWMSDDRHGIAAGDKTVLIIEDDSRFAKILADLARQRGYKCLIAGDGSSGLQIAFEHHPTAIMLDLGLPDIDGLSVLDQLKHHLPTRHIPVHVVSGRDDQAAVLKRGAVGHLLKPADSEELADAFTRIETFLQTGVRKVLVVEDNESLRKSLVRLIAHQGIDIQAVGTGAEACEMLLESTFDGIILDLGLPDMTGFEFLRRLQKLPCEKTPPVVVYTGRDLTRQEHAELNRYTDSIVLKEADSEERVLDEVLLFLHSVESSLPGRQQQVVRMLHDPDQVLEGRKILLVDDDMRNTYALSNVLQKSGLDVVMADNGKLALEKLDEESDIDLVVMDIMMPVMDGYEAMRAIRSRPDCGKLPIIALTAKAMPEDRAKCLEAGANDYLTKPVDVEKLLSLMRVWLFQSKSAHV